MLDLDHFEQRNVFFPESLRIFNNAIGLLNFKDIPVGFTTFLVFRYGWWSTRWFIWWWTIWWSVRWWWRSRHGNATWYTLFHYDDPLTTVKCQCDYLSSFFRIKSLFRSAQQQILLLRPTSLNQRCAALWFPYKTSQQTV